MSAISTFFVLDRRGVLWGVYESYTAADEMRRYHDAHLSASGPFRIKEHREATTATEAYAAGIGFLIGLLVMGAAVWGLR